TGPGNFGRRLAAALSSLGISMLPSHVMQSPDVFLGNAFFDGFDNNIPAILRVDGPGIRGDIARVAAAHKYADVVIYQSEYSRGVLQTKHNYVPQVSYVINNGTKLPNVYHDRTKDIDVLSICHNWSQERYEHFYHAVYSNLSWLAHEFPRFRWNVIGKYQPFKDATTLCSSVHPDTADKHVRYIEFTPNLDMIRRAATLCIHIVGGDSCPNSVIESMSYGLPCIVWHDSAGPELIDYDQGGVVLNGYGADEIVTAVRTILDNYEQYSQNARRLAEEKFDINVVAKKYAEVFHAAAA
ncbi:MAG: glycosyltransferase family 4 protein, partial [Candidatus Thorarchaeota archaeon]